MPETIQDTEHTMINKIKHDPHPLELTVLQEKQK